MSESARHPLSVVQLLLAAAIWGFAFVAQRAGMEYVGPFTFNGIRFLLGAAAIVPFLRVRRRAVAVSIVEPIGRVAWGVVLAGIVLFVSATLQQTGVVYTTAGKAGFVTGLYVVIVPLIGLLRRQKVGLAVWCGVGFALGGLYLLTITGRFGLDLGDGLVLASAFGWAIHVHVVGWLAERARPLVVAAVQFGICGTFSLAIALAVETIVIERLMQAAVPILYAGLLSTGVAYTLQVIAQRRVSPARAGIVFSLEGAFAVLGGWVLLGETMTGRMLAGCALMLIGMIVSQIRRSHAATVA